MATESDLRNLLQGPDPEGRPAIDLDAVLSRARRRRRPRVIAAQALGSVAVVGALFVGVSALVPPAQTASMVAEDTAGGGTELYSMPESADAADGTLRLAAETCGQPYQGTSVPGAATLEIAPLSTDEGTDLTVPVTLRNDGAEPISGVATTPRIVLTLGGVVVGYAPAVDLVGLPVELDPGMSTTFDAVVLPYACDPDDPEAPIETLAVLPPGDYEMRAVLQFASDGDADEAAKESGVIVGAPQPLVIR